ncbi:MAG: hypothetical protein V7720_08810 [Halioglobus sp.]
MATLYLAAALLVTVLPAWLWLERLVPKGITARTCLIAGYSGLLGMLATTLIMQTVSALGILISLQSVGGAALLLAVAAKAVPQTWRTTSVTAPARDQQTLSRLQQCLILICLALLASRLLVLGMEVGTRPVWSWDAKQHWTKQAKVFFELRSIAPYVPLQEWLQLGGKGVYTNMHPDYPIATPLLQAWISIAIGQWHDSLVNAPWVLMWLSLGLVFYGQARVAGASPTVAIAATYMILSLPYLNIHVALAGYADLLMAACYLGAVAALYNWSQSRERWQLILALLCGVCCLLIKNEGFYWFLTLFPGILLVIAGTRKGIMCAAALAVALLALMWIMPADFAVAGHSLEDLNLKYRPDSWRPLYLSALVHDNWHMLGYLFLAAILIIPFSGHRQIPLAAVTLSAVLLYMALYLLTDNAAGAVRFTSLNRVFLQLAPAIAFFTLTVYLTLSGAPPKDPQVIAR